MNANPLPQIQLSADGVTWGAVGAKLQVSANATFYARLASTQNVDSTTWQILTTDELGTAASVGAGTGIGQSQAQGTAAGTGTCLILLATINGGVDKTTETSNPATTTCTAKVWVPAANGYEVVAYDEHGESSAYWWVPLINRGIRNSAGGGSADVNPTPNTLLQRDGAGQGRCTSFATASSAVATVGALRMVAGAQVVAAIAGQTHTNVQLLGVANSGANLQLGDGVEILNVDAQGASFLNVGTDLIFAPAVTPFIFQSQLAGTGGAAGNALTVWAQQGQAQTGSADNNNGGALYLLGGSAGTGGSGAAGVQGSVFVQGGAISLSGGGLSLGLSSSGLLWGSGVAGPLFGQSQVGGTGAANGQTLTLQAQQGQAQTGGAANTNGGNLVLAAGLAGTGGGGAAGTQGSVYLQGAAAQLPSTSALADSLSSSAIFTVSPTPSTGNRHGIDFEIIGQTGQAQTGTNANNNGGDVYVEGGSAGTGGSGAAGAQGNVYLRGTKVNVGGNSGQAVGFYGTPAIAQPSRIGQLTDSTGGTPSGTLAAIAAGASYSQTDMQAVQNALASLAHRQNQIEALLSAAGSGFGLTA